MIWRTRLFLILTCLVFSCKREKAKDILKTAASEVIQNSTDVIEVDDFLAISQNENIKIIDFRKEEKYLKSHIPNALNLWRTDIEDKTYPYKGMSAKKETMEKLIQSLGIAEDDIVIIYDDMGLVDAARLWWVLKSYNFKTIKLLNGGWQAWNEIGGQTNTDIPDVKPSNFQFSKDVTKDMFVDMTDVSKIVADDAKDIVLMDTRTTEEFSGKRLKKGASRSGRIPQSQHIDWMSAIDETNAHKFKSVEELEKIYAPHISTKDTPVIAYCHTGVRSALRWFMVRMELF